MKDLKEGVPSEEIIYWLAEIAAAKKREKDYRKDGLRILEIYEGKKKDTIPFNILFSNTQTLLPALYSSIPVPVVNRRFKDDDPLGKVSAHAAQRMLAYLVDINNDGYETFHDGLKAATVDGLLPGRGITSVKYDADISDSVEISYKQSELVCLESRSWNRVLFGYAKKWSKVPWVAYEEQIDEKEGERLFGKLNKNLVYTASEETEEEGERNKDADEKNTGERKTALIYQIWDKEDRRVKYISPQYRDGFLSAIDDPLELTGFFNCPKPLQFIFKSNSLIPTALYSLYENQAKEINEITRRINRLVKAIKAKGIYDAELGEDIKKLVEADDNELVPADKSSSLAAEKGLQNAIWFWPIEQLIAVLVQLYQAREAAKKVIYEITGISDIIRGQSVASETLGAQKIKESWGTLRLQDAQKEVQRYSRDLLILMLEIAATKFSEKTWAGMTGLPFLLTEQKQQLMAVAQAGQQMVMQNPQLQQDPAFQQKAQQLQAELQKPVWGDVLALLRDDTQRSYRIDIETNSTVEPEAVEDQKNISDVMTALGQFLNGITPLVTSGSMPFQAAQSMMLAIVRRFRFGSEIEDYVKAMKEPQPPDDGKAAEQAKMQMEQQSKEADMQMEKERMAFEMKKAEVEEKRIQAVEMAKHQREEKQAQSKLVIEQVKMQQEKEIAFAEIQAEKEAELAKLQAQRETERMKAQLQQDTELKKAKIAQDTELMKAELVKRTTIETARVAAGGKTEDEMNTDQDNIQKAIDTIMESNMQLMKSITAPRRRRAVRDKSGKIQETVEEMVHGEGMM